MVVVRPVRQTVERAPGNGSRAAGAPIQTGGTWQAAGGAGCNGML